MAGRRGARRGGDGAGTIRGRHGDCHPRAVGAVAPRTPRRFRDRRSVQAVCYLGPATPPQAAEIAADRCPLFIAWLDGTKLYGIPQAAGPGFKVAIHETGEHGGGDAGDRRREVTPEEVEAVRAGAALRARPRRAGARDRDVSLHHDAGRAFYHRPRGRDPVRLRGRVQRAWVQVRDRDR